MIRESSLPVTKQSAMENAVRTSELRYRRLFESAKDGILIIDADTTEIIDINPFLIDLLGYSREELLGQKLCQAGLFDHAGEDEIIIEQLRDQQYVHGDFPFKTKTGRRIDVELVSNLHDEGDHAVIQLNIRDISGRKRADALLIGQNRVLEMLATGVAIQDVLATLMQVIEEQSDGIFASILICKKDSHHFHIGIAPSLPEGFLAAYQNRSFLPPYSGPCAMTAHCAEMVVCNDLTRDPRWPEEGRLLAELGLTSCYCSPVLSSDGRVLGSFAIYQRDSMDVRTPDRQLLETATHLTGIAIERRQIELELRESDRRKDEFLATLSHELRNPLASIRNAVQLLKHSETSSLTSTSDVLERQVAQMVRLVDDLLEVSRISLGKFTLNRSVVEFTPVIQQAVEATSASLHRMDHRLTLDLPSVPVYVNGDSCRLSQVVANLLDNACKYTGIGGDILVALEVEGDSAVLRVRDTGVGITPDQFERIFEMFTQVDASLERSRSGLGIGLTLVKSLVELHGGSVSVSSAGAGRGTEFTVRLPREETTAQPSRPTETAAAGNYKVLIVDDDVDAAATLATLLNLIGHQTETINESTLAVRKAAEFQPDVVLLDIGMPTLNGYQVAKQIRRQPWGQQPVLLALTGWGQDGDRRKSTEAGFDGHLVKPTDYQVLNRMMSELCSSGSTAKKT